MAREIYTCVRCGRARRDTRLASYWTCDECVAELLLAFSGEMPVWVGDHVDGYCTICNEPKTVTLRQWMVCLICDRVTRSIGRGRVAVRFVEHWWGQNVQPHLPNLELEERDPPQFRPYQRADVEHDQPDADFVVSDKAQPQELFAVELKTGSSSIGGTGGMSQFQLDTSDCDQIMEFVQRRRLPAYVVHAQVVEQYEPPTTRYVALALWWTDIYQMAEAFQMVRRRQTEQRQAAFFHRKCFQPIATFAEAIRERHYEALAQRLRREGMPTLYRLA